MYVLFNHLNLSRTNLKYTIKYLNKHLHCKWIDKKIINKQKNDICKVIKTKKK